MRGGKKKERKKERKEKKERKRETKKERKKQRKKETKKERNKARKKRKKERKEESKKERKERIDKTTISIYDGLLDCLVVWSLFLAPNPFSRFGQHDPSTAKDRGTVGSPSNALRGDALRPPPCTPLQLSIFMSFTAHLNIIPCQMPHHDKSWTNALPDVAPAAHQKNKSGCETPNLSKSGNKPMQIFVNQIF